MRISEPPLTSLDLVADAVGPLIRARRPEWAAPTTALRCRFPRHGWPAGRSRNRRALPPGCRGRRDGVVVGPDQSGNTRDTPILGDPAGHGRIAASPAMKVTASRPFSSLPHQRRAPANPTSARCVRTARTKGEFRPCGRRTVSPMRTTPSVTSPPSNGTFGPMGNTDTR